MSPLLFSTSHHLPSSADTHSKPPLYCWPASRARLGPARTVTVLRLALPLVAAGRGGPGLGLPPLPPGRDAASLPDRLRLEPDDEDGHVVLAAPPEANIEALLAEEAQVGLALLEQLGDHPDSLQIRLDVPDAVAGHDEELVVRGGAGLDDDVGDGRHLLIAGAGRDEGGLALAGRIVEGEGGLDLLDGNDVATAIATATAITTVGISTHRTAEGIAIASYSLHHGRLLLEAEIAQPAADGQIALHPAPADVAAGGANPALLLLVIRFVIVAEGDGPGVGAVLPGVDGAGIAGVGANEGGGGEEFDGGGCAAVLVLRGAGGTGITAPDRTGGGGRLGVGGVGRIGIPFHPHVEVGQGGGMLGGGAGNLPVGGMPLQVVLPVRFVGVGHLHAPDLQQYLPIERDEGIGEGGFEQIEAVPVLQLPLLLGGRSSVRVVHSAAASTTTLAGSTSRLASLLFFGLLGGGDPAAVLGVFDERGLAAQNAAHIEAGVLGREGSAVPVEDGVQRVAREADLPPLLGIIAGGVGGGGGGIGGVGGVTHFGIGRFGAGGRRSRPSIFSFLFAIPVFGIIAATTTIFCTNLTVAGVLLGEQKGLADVRVLHVDPPALHAGDAVRQIDSAITAAIF